MLKPSDMDKLESIIDGYSLRELAEAMEEIAYAKAGHIAANYGDEPLAESWEHDGALFSKLTGKLQN